jgi:hypothetical protein
MFAVLQGHTTRNESSREGPGEAPCWYWDAGPSPGISVVKDPDSFLNIHLHPDLCDQAMVSLVKESEPKMLNVFHMFWLKILQPMPGFALNFDGSMKLIFALIDDEIEFKALLAVPHGEELPADLTVNSRKGRLLRVDKHGWLPDIGDPVEKFDVSQCVYHRAFVDLISQFAREVEEAGLLRQLWAHSTCWSLQNALCMVVAIIWTS